jgi:hypothetical protein
VNEVPPAGAVIESVTVKIPSELNWCCGDAEVDGADPSPKSQENPVPFDEVFVKSTTSG